MNRRFPEELTKNTWWPGLHGHIRACSSVASSRERCAWRTTKHWTSCIEQLRSQNNGLNGVFSLCDDWFPASGTDSSQNDDFRTADLQFQNGRRVNKMAPRCFLGRIPRCTGTENGCPMEDLRWTVSFQPIGTHWTGFDAFQLAFYFRITTFSFYSDFAGTN